jgi:hypothetical protein
MLTIREVEDKDLFPLADFLPRGFPNTTTDFWIPLFELWWTSNPAYTDQFKRGWILENETSIVGFIGNIPVKFLIRGVMQIAAVSNSWYVDPSVRGIFSLRLFNEFVKQKNASLLFFKKDNDSLTGILHTYKFKEFILPRNQKEFVYLIDKKRFYFIFFRFLLKLRIPRLSEFSESYKKFGFLLLAYFLQKPFVRKGHSGNTAYISSLCTLCDEAFYKIWEPHLKACDFAMSRDTKTLNWLYFSQARLYPRVVIQCRRSVDKTLAGYMVFDIQRTNPSDDGIMKLMDICIVNNDHDVLASLLSYAIKIGKQNNAALLVVWADNPETEIYLKNMFTIRMPGKYHRYVKFSDLHGSKSLEDDHGTICLPMIYPPQ